jgi:putative heme-binding domain-containing protein
MAEPIESFVLSETLGTLVWESVRGDLTRLAPKLCERIARRERLEPQKRGYLRDLCLLVGASGTVDEVRQTLLLLSMDHPEIAMTILLGVSEGLSYSSNDVLRVGLMSLLKSPPADWESVVRLVKPWTAHSIAIACDAAASPESRIEAISLWPILLAEESTSRLIEIGREGANDAVQRHAVGILAGSPAGLPIDQFLGRWQAFSAPVKESLLAACWARGDSTKLALLAMKRGEIPASLVPVDRRELLLIHTDDSIRELSKELFGEAASKDREGVITSYSPSLNSTGDATKGEQVFRRVCAACHRIGNEGHRVGPDITDVRNKTAEQLLAEVLDPNRIVEPRYSVSTVLMKDGRSMTGIVVSQSGQQVVLLKSGGIEDRLRREEIEEIQSSSQSLMPVGLEKEVTPIEMNDLITYLRSNR